MNKLLEEIKSHGVLEEDVVYLSEGIVFFKNSSKLKALYKTMNRKVEKLKVKGKYTEEIKTISELMEKIQEIVGKFESVEDKYKSEKTKEQKEAIKQEYKNLEKDFNDLLAIAKQERNKKILLAVGLIGIVVAILLIGAIGLSYLEQAGSTLTLAGTNIKSRVEKMSMLKDIQGMSIANDPALNSAAKNVAGAVGGAYYDTLIKQTNNALFQTAMAGGATVASVATAGIISDIKEKKIENKSMIDTLQFVEKLKKEEKQ